MLSYIENHIDDKNNTVKLLDNTQFNPELIVNPYALSAELRNVVTRYKSLRVREMNIVMGCLKDNSEPYEDQIITYVCQLASKVIHYQFVDFKLLAQPQKTIYQHQDTLSELHFLSCINLEKHQLRLMNMPMLVVLNLSGSSFRTFTAVDEPDQSVDSDDENPSERPSQFNVEDDDEESDSEQLLTPNSWFNATKEHALNCMEKVVLSDCKSAEDEFLPRILNVCPNLQVLACEGYSSITNDPCMKLLRPFDCFKSLIYVNTVNSRHLLNIFECLSDENNLSLPNVMIMLLSAEEYDWVRYIEMFTKVCPKLRLLVIQHTEKGNTILAEKAVEELDKPNLTVCFTTLWALTGYVTKMLNADTTLYLGGPIQHSTMNAIVEWDEPLKYVPHVFPQPMKAVIAEDVKSVEQEIMEYAKDLSNTDDMSV